MMNTTRLAWQALLFAAVLGAGTAMPSAQQESSGDDWCRDNSRNWRGNNRVEHCEVREFTVAASGATLAVDAAPNGGVAVQGAPRGDILVRARVSANARSMDQARALVSRVQVSATPARVTAEGPDNLQDNEGWSVSYRISAPNGTPLAVTTTNGGIDLRDLNSEIEAKTVNGGITLTSVSGAVRARTSNGGITVALDGSTWDGQGLTAETSNGGITLRVPQSYSARLEARTQNGGIDVDFPVTTQGRIGRFVSAELGGGGPTLSLTTSNGGIRVTRGRE